jgi:multiple sugar transport system substrate-binding protein
MKKLSLFLVLTLLMTLLAPVALAEQNINVWMGSWWAPFIPTIEEKFAADNPGYTVHVEPVPINNYLENVVTSIVGGTAPDVVALDALHIPTLVGQGLLLPLDKFYADSGLTAADFSPSMYQAGVTDGISYNVPYRSAPCVLFYNKTLFDAAGLAYPTNDWSFDDLLQAAIKLTDKDKGIYGFAIGTSNADPANVMTNFAPILWGFGADFLNEDLTASAMNTQAAVDAVKWFVELHTKYDVVPEGCVNYTLANDEWPMAANGQIAMIQMGDSMASTIEQKSAELGYEYGYCLEVGSHTRGGGWGYSIPSTIKDPTAAELYIKWFVTSGILADQSIVLPGVIADQHQGMWATDLYDTWYEADQTAMLCPNTPKWTEIQNAVIIELQKALNSEVTPEEAVANMDSQITSILAE